MSRYQEFIEGARGRLSAAERQTLEHPRLGLVEYASWGAGRPFFLCHPLFGGFDLGPGLAETYVGRDHRFIAPSRFGYLGSTLPQAVTPADQADAYAWILDTLGIRQTVVFGYSAGGPSAIQFAIRHASRTTALVLMASALPGKAGAPPRAVAQALFGSDWFFWLLKRHAPALFARLLGMPKGFRATDEERRRVAEAADSLFPIRPRKPGVLYDLYVSNPEVQRYPLEEISVPTLVINARDDSMSAFENAAHAAERIPGARLLAIERGGHLLLGAESRVQREIADFATANP